MCFLVLQATTGEKEVASAGAATDVDREKEIQQAEEESGSGQARKFEALVFKIERKEDTGDCGSKR